MTSMQKAVIFTAGKDEYAIPVTYVYSIERPVNITPIPQMPGYVAGLAKVRDELLPLLDLEKILYGTKADMNSGDYKWILIQAENLTAGLAVKDAREIMEIPEENIKQIGLASYHKTSYISGVASMPERDLIPLINPVKLIDSLEGIKELKVYVEDQA
ncbi:chemotaxis protein CheW [Peribacillus kribbensis]|uniref:chemotaxis protein CheW n=1 Tax=Peribacillus kribbensis TaxID=356658 RepID=UPI0004087A2F|nr:chemotaxis protein CheW [Peribacillus kribbensis]